MNNFLKLFLSIQICLIDSKTGLVINLFLLGLVGWFIIICRTLVWVSFTPLLRCSQCILLSQTIGLIMSNLRSQESFFTVSMYSKRIDPLFISSRINWNFISICSDFWWTTGFLPKTILDWLLQWIVVGFLSDLSSIIVPNSAQRYWASWLANDIAIKSTLYVDNATEFCFLDFLKSLGYFLLV